ncbi:TlpA disulfide reductase family protein [Bacteroides sedimenti]|uniref:Thiol:disulfide interchange protein n=1 Tax=Bacteroides sedimenti TaxID=2136147 RepID=A0ABN6Z5S9_9BACE
MKYNKAIYAILLITTLFCNKTNAAPFQLKGRIANVKDSTIIELFYTTFKNNKWIKISNSAMILNGEFLFKGDIDETTAACLDYPNRIIPIYIEPAKMQLHIDGNNPYRYQLIGTTVEKENTELRKQLLPYWEFYYGYIDKAIDLSKKKTLFKDNATISDSLFSEMRNLTKMKDNNRRKMDSVWFDFASRHLSFQITPDLLNSISEDGFVGIDSIRSVYDNLPVQNKNSLMGKLALKQIEEHEYRDKVLKNTLVGAFPPDFIRKSISGKTVKLSDYKNKTYVLLDFWASWCVPCLKEMPKMKEIYKKYRDKGLNIIGVSLDRDRNSWSKAVQKNGLNIWPQVLSSVSTGKSTNSDFSIDNLSDLYNCDAVPFFVLIDRDGKVVAKWQYMGDAQLQELDKYLNTENKK